jgi:hypothetical protein
MKIIRRLSEPVSRVRGGARRFASFGFAASVRGPLATGMPSAIGQRSRVRRIRIGILEAVAEPADRGDHVWPSFLRMRVTNTSIVFESRSKSWS